jgi:hypothetical protein
MKRRKPGSKGRMPRSWRPTAELSARVAAAKKDREKAYVDREREDAEAWRNPPTGVTGDSWVDALIAFLDRKDVGPLVAYLEAATELTREQLRALAGVLRLVHAKPPKRWRGRPKGTLSRLHDPNQIATQFVKRDFARWKIDTGKRKIPEKIKDAIITKRVSYINSWDFVKTHGRASVERVKELLRVPKTRRL